MTTQELTTYTLDEIKGTQTIVRHEGEIIGSIYGWAAVNGTFRASRKNGTADDMRRMAYGFRSIEKAAEWIAKGAK